MEGPFDPEVIQDEINMLTALIAELEEKIKQLEIQMVSLRHVRAALASSIDVELPKDDKSQLKLSLLVDGVEPIAAAIDTEKLD
tara:strand:+ start:1292 stop:1543 length:252 start_codon:yes stop_codon:yes gene_type:complete